MNDKQFFWITAGAVAFILLIVMGAKILWSNIIYENTRCAFAECRIYQPN